ncbi:hypothetical protein PspLS_00015 [Pyricularia sp. CBS 133598]|nr:hypothetical protein PspLS_00015 [Pyricularia sp. CBS 133598]
MIDIITTQRPPLIFFWGCTEDGPGDSCRQVCVRFGGTKDTGGTPYHVQRKYTVLAKVHFRYHQQKLVNCTVHSKVRVRYHKVCKPGLHSHPLCAPVRVQRTSRRPPCLETSKQAGPADPHTLPYCTVQYHDLVFPA